VQESLINENTRLAKQSKIEMINAEVGLIQQSLGKVRSLSREEKHLLQKLKFRDEISKQIATAS